MTPTPYLVRTLKEWHALVAKYRLAKPGNAIAPDDTHTLRFPLIAVAYFEDDYTWGHVTGAYLCIDATPLSTLEAKADASTTFPHLPWHNR